MKPAAEFSNYTNGAWTCCDPTYVPQLKPWLELWADIEDILRDFTGKLPEHEQAWENEGGAT